MTRKTAMSDRSSAYLEFSYWEIRIKIEQVQIPMDLSQYRGLMAFVALGVLVELFLANHRIDRYMARQLYQNLRNLFSL